MRSAGSPCGRAASADTRTSSGEAPGTKVGFEESSAQFIIGEVTLWSLMEPGTAVDGTHGGLCAERVQPPHQ